jgi:gliding motility-associated-like protein
MSKNLNILFLILLIGFSVKAQTTVTFNYTGSAQTWTVPPCVTSITVTVAGAEGGGTTGGNGAIVTGTLTVTPGQTLQMNVGGSGNCPQAGWNGGGNGQNASTAANRSCGGGGASDIRISPYNLSNRLIVAAGGGGMGGGTSDAAGGNGGCASGVAGTSPFGQGGGPGTQTAGGAAGPPWISSGYAGTAGTLGVGGNGGSDPCYNVAPGGGGGGGYYGGGGGGSDCYSSAPYGGGSGGGGSSLVPSAGGCNPGTNNGPGYITITYTAGAGTATATNTGPYCAGGTIQLNASGGTTGSTYSWTGPNGFSSSLQNPTISSATSANAGVYNLTVTSTGCSATATTTVVVNPIPTVNAGTDQSFCAGTSVTLSATGAATFSWDNGVTNGVAFTPAVGTIIYTVTGTTSGCTATDQVSVTVNPIPTVNAGTDQAICATSGVTLTATTSGTSTVSWDNGVTDGVAFTPVSTATYTVTGVSANGCTSTDQVTVTVNPLPVISIGADQTVCEGTTVTLTASGADSYTWSDGTTANPLIFVPSLGTTTISCTGTTLAGCTGTDDAVITVNPNPSPVITGALEYCTGNFSTLNTTATFSSYQWSDGSTNSTLDATQANNPITVTVTNSFGCSGISPAFTVTEITTVSSSTTITICDGETVIIHGNPETLAGTYIQNFTSVAGCDSIATVVLIVNPLPPVNAGADKVICTGATVTLIASGANSYSWDNGVVDGVTFTPPVGTTTYTVSGTDLNGCINSDQVDVTSNALPTVDAGQDQSICIGAQVTLTGSGASVYNWNNGVSDGVPFSPTATTTYTVTGTDSNGCIDSDNITVTVNTIPTVNAGNDIVVCEGINITLTGAGAQTYSWDNNVSNNVSFLPPVGTTTYTVIGTSSSGCTDQDQVNVTVSPTPVVSIAADVTTGCIPLSVNLTNTGSVGDNCSWTLSDGTLLTGCGTVNHLFETAGCHDITLTVTNSNGCIGTFTAFDLICTEAPPNASFFPTPSVISEYNTQVGFVNTSTGATDYSWTFGNNNGMSTQVEPSYDFTGAQSNQLVTLVASTPMGCTDTATSVIIFEEETIYYIPNTFTPDGDMFNQTFQPVFTSGFDPYNFSLYIYNRWGELIFESHDADQGWDGTYGAGSKNVGIVPDGIYTWKVEFKPKNNDNKFVDIGHVTVIR